MASRVGRPPKQIKAIMGRIREDWVTGKSPGERLPLQTELARQYGANPKTVKSALHELAQAGSILSRPYGRFQVSGKAHITWRAYLGKSIGFAAYTARWLDDSFARSVFEGVRQRLSTTGINLTVPTRACAMRSEGPYLPPPLFGSMDLVGMILLGLDPLKSFEKPKVAVDFDAVEDGIDSFCFDNFGAGKLLAQRLHRLGHRRAAIIVENPVKPKGKMDPAWSARLAGILSEFADAKAPPPAQLPLKGRNKLSPIWAALRVILRKPLSRRPTALILPSDLSSEIRNLAKEVRLKVRRDLTLVGFAEADAITDMTSIRFDGLKLGHAAAHLLLTRLQDPSWRTRKARLHAMKGRYVAGKTHGRAPQAG